MTDYTVNCKPSLGGFLDLWRQPKIVAPKSTMEMAASKTVFNEVSIDDAFTSSNELRELLQEIYYYTPDCEMLAILQSFYRSSIKNPYYFGLVERLLNPDLLSKASFQVYECFWLCVPLQSNNVISIKKGLFQPKILEIMFRLFVFAREIFDEYLLAIKEQLSNEFIIVNKKFETHARNPSMSGHLLEYFKTLCWFRMNELVVGYVLSLELFEIVLPLQMIVWPFIRFPEKNDTKICRHFKETDSGEDVKRFEVFRREYKNGLGFGYVPKLFNLSRSVVRRTIFNAAGSSTYKKFVNLQEIDIPCTLKKRLCYFPI